MSRLTAELAQEAVGLLRNQGYESTVRLGYSGRAMYGETCVGIVTEAGGPMVGWAITASLFFVDHDTWDMIPQRSDSMGTLMIYY